MKFLSVVILLSTVLSSAAFASDVCVVMPHQPWTIIGSIDIGCSNIDNGEVKNQTIPLATILKQKLDIGFEIQSAAGSQMGLVYTLVKP
jgi:hypothetical protein